MKLFKEWLLRLFSKKEDPKKLLLEPQDENFLLHLEVAELKISIMDLSEIIRKTNKTIVVLQDNVNQANKTSDLALKLANGHEDIFNKIIEEKILVFGLTKKTKIINSDDSTEPD